MNTGWQKAWGIRDNGQTWDSVHAQALELEHVVRAAFSTLDTYGSQAWLEEQLFDLFREGDYAGFYISSAFDDWARSGFWTVGIGYNGYAGTFIHWVEKLST